MKREDLRKLGLTDEQVDQVMSMNGEDVNASKAIVAQRDETIRTLTTERDGLKEQVAAPGQGYCRHQENGWRQFCPDAAAFRTANEVQRRYCQAPEEPR